MLTQLLLSMVAIAMLTALAWRLGFRHQPSLDLETACTEAANGIPGFQPDDVFLSADRRCALVRGRDGQIVLVRGVGDGWHVRSLPAEPASISPDGIVHVPLREPMVRTFDFASDAPAPSWLDKTA